MVDRIRNLKPVEYPSGITVGAHRGAGRVMLHFDGAPNMHLLTPDQAKALVDAIQGAMADLSRKGET